MCNIEIHGFNKRKQMTSTNTSQASEELRVIGFEVNKTDYLERQSSLARKLFNKCYEYIEEIGRAHV